MYYWITIIDFKIGVKLLKIRSRLDGIAGSAPERALGWIVMVSTGWEKRALTFLD
jgi:hypothetical protein